MKLSDLKASYEEHKRFLEKYEKKNVYPLIVRFSRRRQEMKKLFQKELTRRGFPWERIANGIYSIWKDKGNFTIILPVESHWHFILRSHSPGKSPFDKPTAEITLDIDTPVKKVVDAAINLVAMESMTNGGADQKADAF